MTGIEALQALKDGKRVRLTTWAKDEFLYWDKKIDNICEEKGNLYSGDGSGFIRYDNWETYDEESLTLQELAGYTIKFKGIKYYVVPHYITRIHKDTSPTIEFCLMPLSCCYNSGLLVSYPANTKIPKKAIVDTPEENGVVIMNYNIDE